MTIVLVLNGGLRLQMVAARARQVERSASVQALLANPAGSAPQLPINPFAMTPGMTVEAFRRSCPCALYDIFVKLSSSWNRGLASVMPLISRHPHLLTPPSRLTQRPINEMEQQPDAIVAAMLAGQALAVQ
jgi:hypothetical protein